MKNKTVASYISLILMFTAGSAFADDWSPTFSGGVSAASHFLWRGSSLSENEPSVGVSAMVSTKPGFYFAYGLHTVDFGADGSKGQHQGLNLLTLGYETDFSGVKIGVGGTKYLFVGSNDVNDLSFGELFLRGSWNGLHAQLWHNIDGSKGDNSRLNNGDTYGSIGYSHQLGKFSIGADVGYYWYKSDSAVNGVSDATVHVGYNYSDNLSVTATYLVDGKMPNGNRWDTTKFVLSANFAF